MQSSTKRTISVDQWQAKLAQVKVPKEDMNRLIMNFLVTEVRCLQTPLADNLGDR